MYLVVSYDVPDDRRRLKVMKALKDYGKRVQYSVFECDLEPRDQLRLRQRLDRLINPEEDDVRFYFLCQSCLAKARRLGGQREAVRRPFYIIGGNGRG